MEEQIIIFDGECNLCNGVVSWLLNRDSIQQFRYVPFQSPRGQALLTTHQFPTARLTTVILIKDCTAYTHSDGFLKILEQVPRFNTIAKLLQWVPLWVRDNVYNYASSQRLAWFGKSTSCNLSI
ncbi:thiol-disulfide oxidoreductase DCC family protein [Croceivirga sp. JEA036]|uniref:thiol-disulfide oxidoreductase DCC family protein n=1 Tax=Croceivirga sp. JEA036 TaxID=2721162 RepID=UPI001438F489|nr:DUF393 domain-containing protein [Croceivirga sp. JEA036]NJB37179.1 DUF393 domain-containing protein [Croceivirga sp. JEA036]